MIPLAVFFMLMAIISYIDIKEKTIPNFIILPWIFIAGFYLHTGLAVTTAFLIGCGIYKRQKLAGGDVKLFVMVTAFLGWPGLLALPLTILLIKLYRKIRDNYAPVAVAPFVFVASVAIVIAECLIRQFCL